MYNTKHGDRNDLFLTRVSYGAYLCAATKDSLAQNGMDFSRSSSLQWLAYLRHQLG